jgi:hypothetical protein
MSSPWAWVSVSDHHVEFFMKKTQFFLPLCVLILVLGCEKRSFHFVATITQAPAFAIDHSGAFQLALPVMSAVIQGAVDIPEGGQITRLDIESLALRAVASSGNQGSAVQISGVIIENGGAQQTLFDRETITINSTETPLAGLKTLNAAGVSKLRSKLEGYVKNTDNQSFVIQLFGETAPSGQRVVADLQVVLKATVKYSQCLEVPGLFSSGEKCSE